MEWRTSPLNVPGSVGWLGCHWAPEQTTTSRCSVRTPDARVTDQVPSAVGSTATTSCPNSIRAVRP
jgi:hypothetical protein